MGQNECACLSRAPFSRDGAATAVFTSNQLRFKSAIILKFELFVLVREEKGLNKTAEVVTFKKNFKGIHLPHICLSKEISLEQ